ncbi:hypothetical protein AX774_g2897 [Zancudomyces culisetae]|uniref:Uncharacterized protein n=1 Tax=Zancudomyces culisetae TaxID=1213189 RepID=A0A1R1PRL5_ZANCU|nr:hypothetical protein AX774_g2897 [Zancudomyces culisetae]|eukprot:OMH83594.1 hypothetical protein AX774_g2897 [Zancudomyces culisetae]
MEGRGEVGVQRGYYVGKSKTESSNIEDSIFETDSELDSLSSYSGNSSDLITEDDILEVEDLDMVSEASIGKGTDMQPKDFQEDKASKEKDCEKVHDKGAEDKDLVNDEKERIQEEEKCEYVKKEVSSSIQSELKGEEEKKEKEVMKKRK